MLDIDENEDSALHSVESIYNQLLIHGELVVILEASDVARLRNALSVHKTRASKMLKEAGMPVDKTVLRYEQTILDSGQVQLHIIHEQATVGFKLYSIAPPGEL